MFLTPVLDAAPHVPRHDPRKREPTDHPRAAIDERRDASPWEDARDQGVAKVVAVARREERP
jgi:hypothetical protein